MYIHIDVDIFYAVQERSEQGSSCICTYRYIYIYVHPDGFYDSDTYVYMYAPMDSMRRMYTRRRVGSLKI